MYVFNESYYVFLNVLEFLTCTRFKQSTKCEQSLRKEDFTWHCDDCWKYWIDYSKSENYDKSTCSQKISKLTAENERDQDGQQPHLLVLVHSPGYGWWPGKLIAFNSKTKRAKIVCFSDTCL